MKLFYNKSTRTFSEVTKSFSDWDQIRDLVNDQLPKGIIRVSKVRGSDDGKSYQVVPHYKGGKTGKPVTVPINGKSALDNYNRATGSKVENTSKPKVSDKTKEKYKLDKENKDKVTFEAIFPRRGFITSPDLKIINDKQELDPYICHYVGTLPSNQYNRLKDEWTEFLRWKWEPGDNDDEFEDIVSRYCKLEFIKKKK